MAGGSRNEANQIQISDKVGALESSRAWASREAGQRRASGSCLLGVWRKVWCGVWTGGDREGGSGKARRTHCLVIVWSSDLHGRNTQLGDSAITDSVDTGGETAAASVKSSSTAVSSKSGKGVIIAELGMVCHFHAADGVSLISVADGLK